MLKSWNEKIRNFRVEILGLVPGNLLKSVANSNHVFRKILPYNFYILLDIQDKYIGRPLLVKGSYEQRISETFAKYLQPDSCVIDIGANIGYYSLLAASRCPQGKVLSFEPDKQNFQLLKTSIVYNGFEQIIQAYNLAVSDTNKSIMIADLGTTVNSGARVTSINEDLLKSLVADKDASLNKIEAVQLDSFVIANKVDIVKIDIEGHEPYAVRGMLNILKRDQPVIFAELAPSSINLFSGMEPSDFLQPLIDIGYSISLIERSGKLIEFHQDISAVMIYFTQAKTHHIDIILTTCRHQI
jgi:FkbM family methyltransferase